MNETGVLDCIIATLRNNQKLDLKLLLEAVNIVAEIARRTKMQQIVIMQMV